MSLDATSSLDTTNLVVWKIREGTGTPTAHLLVFAGEAEHNKFGEASPNGPRCAPGFVQGAVRACPDVWLLFISGVLV
jgi:hypothetical protein